VALWGIGWFVFGGGRVGGGAVGCSISAEEGSVVVTANRRFLVTFGETDLRRK
jgi:hypothetical protein